MNVNNSTDPMLDSPMPSAGAPGSDTIWAPASVAASLTSQDFSPEIAPPQPQHTRPGIAKGVTDLMGGDMDHEGVAADLIDTGRGDMIMWGLDPKPEAVGLVPNLGDWTDPQRWVGATGKLDLPPGVSDAVERLARAAVARIPVDGDDSVRRAFAQRLGALLRDSGIETLAFKGPHGKLDWIVLDANALAREQDGQPWSPPGGRFEDSPDVKRLGVSLGRGGAVSLWPVGADQRTPPPPEALAAMQTQQPGGGAGARPVQVAPRPAPAPNPAPAPVPARGPGTPMV